MNDRRRVSIGQLPTGVPGLDQVLGGGLPEYSFNLIAGAPGTGKTTLAQQIMFANASPERRALYFTVLGEPPVKMLRYQQQYSFFDFEKVDGSIRFINLSQEVLEHDLGRVLESITREVERTSPGLVFVDSFRTVIRTTGSGAPYTEGAQQAFVQRLAIHLTSWQVTSFLIGEYFESEQRENPVFTVADDILWLYQSVEGNAVVRKLQTLKIRGQAPLPGLHTFRITDAGLQVFPRMLRSPEDERRASWPPARVSTGVAGLDEMMHGGIPQGDSVVVAGPSGSGKSTLVSEFLVEGLKEGQPAVVAVFEEHPETFLKRGSLLGVDLEEAVRQGQLEVVHLRPLDLSTDETLLEIQQRIDRIGAMRVAIDSLSGFEIALAPSFRRELREALYRMVRPLTRRGITIMMTMETVPDYNQLRSTPEHISFLADDIVLQLQVELDAKYRKVMNVIKMRSSAHSHDLRIYDITEHGIVMGEVLDEYRGVVTGVPVLLRQAGWHSGLSSAENLVLEALVRSEAATLEALAERTGLRRRDLRRALDGLVGLRYAVEAEADGRTVYRPAPRALSE